MLTKAPKTSKVSYYDYFKLKLEVQMIICLNNHNNLASVSKYVEAADLITPEQNATEMHSERAMHCDAN